MSLKDIFGHVSNDSQLPLCLCNPGTKKTPTKPVKLSMDISSSKRKSELERLRSEVDELRKENENLRNQQEVEIQIYNSCQTPIEIQFFFFFTIVHTSSSSLCVCGSKCVHEFSTVCIDSKI